MRARECMLHVTVSDTFCLRDWMQKFSGAIPELLSAGKRVLIYAGDVDYICNYVSVCLFSTLVMSVFVIHV